MKDTPASLDQPQSTLENENRKLRKINQVLMS